MVITPWKNIRLFKGKKVRKEIRQLTEQELADYIDAMWIMKRKTMSEGKALYGEDYISYDRLVDMHAKQSWSPTCDTGHYTTSFSPAHRAMNNLFEKSLLAIKPNLPGAPYWDARFDVFSYEYNGHSWAEEYVWGSFQGDAEDYYKVKTGPFANWPIKTRDQVDFEDGIFNAYGFHRGRINPNKSPVLTRGGAEACLCGENCGIPVTTPDLLVECLYNSTTFNELIVCSDTGIHGFPHLLIGGAWPSEQSPECKHHTHSLSQFLTDTLPGYSYQYAPSVQCIVPVESCTLDQPETECAYTIASENGMCAGQYNVDESVEETIIPPEYMSIGGDFTDGQTSANDPLFFAHHINMDRIYTLWEALNPDQLATYYGIPPAGTENWCSSGLLDAIVSPNDYELLDGMFGLSAPFTIKDQFDAMSDLDNVNYVYDTYLEMFLPPEDEMETTEGMSVIDQILMIDEFRYSTFDELENQIDSLMACGVTEVEMTDELEGLLQMQLMTVTQMTGDPTDIVGEVGYQLLLSEDTVSLDLVKANFAEEDEKEDERYTEESLSQKSDEELALILQQKQLSDRTRRAIMDTLDQALETEDCPLLPMEDAETTKSPSDGCSCEDMVSMEDFEALREAVRELQGSIGTIEADNNDLMDGMMEMATCMSGMTDKFGKDTTMMPTEDKSTMMPTDRETSTVTPTERRDTKSPTMAPIYSEPTVEPTEEWETIAQLWVDPVAQPTENNKCSTSRDDRAFKLAFTNTMNCLSRCKQDATCVYATTEKSLHCIGCKTLNQRSDGWYAYKIIGKEEGGRRELSEIEQLRAENAALKAELARRN